MHKQKLISKRSIKSGVVWKNIRIHFDYDFLDGTKTDSKMCKSNSQRITWNVKHYTCSSEDILDNNKIRVIKGTFENIRTYLQNFLKVIPLTSSIQISTVPNYLEISELIKVNNIDLYLIVTSRPFSNSEKFAGIHSFYRESTYKRPYFSIAFLNPRKIPSDIQSEHTQSNDFFFSCIHEIFHALGFSASEFQYYHPYEDSTPFTSTTCSITVKGKNLTFLTTPFAMKFAKKRYGVSEFAGDDGNRCPAGIELENVDNSVKSSHLAARTFMTDLMTSKLLQVREYSITRLTDATVAILQDTGNYKCNYSMAQPLVWGNPESINGKPIPNFGIGPWQYVFPSGYVSNDTYSDRTGFDFKFFGLFRGVAPQYCAGDSRDNYCRGKNFYNPLNSMQIGNDALFDYMTYKNPKTLCEKGKAMIIVATDNEWVDKCGEYKCHGYESFTWKDYYSQSDKSSYGIVSCTKGNIGLKQESKYIINNRENRVDITCPDPERFCRSVKLHDAFFDGDPFDEDYTVLKPPKPYSFENLIAHNKFGSMSKSQLYTVIILNALREF